MTNQIEIQLRALRAPRVLKTSTAGDPEFADVWAIHHVGRSSRTFSLAVKFPKKVAAEGLKLRVGTLFTVKGRLDQTQSKETGIYRTFVWADEVSGLAHSKKALTPEEKQAAQAADAAQPETPDA